MKSATSTRPMALMLIGAFTGILLTFLGVQAAFSKPAVASPTITSKPPAVTSGANASFAFTGPSGATFRCKLDSTPSAVCTSPSTYPGLADGVHTFQVVAVVGPDQSNATSYSWTVDTLAPPAPSLTAKPAALSNTTSPSFSFADTEAGVPFSCAIDDNAFAPCSSPKAYSGLPQGSHTFKVKAIDAAGNASTPTSWTWAIDSIAPGAPVLTTRPSDPTPNATNGFAWTGGETGLSYQCSLENGAWQTCTTPYTWVINTGNYGQHQFGVRAVDGAGNTSTPTTYVFKYEKGLPSSGVPFQVNGNVSGLTIGTWAFITLTITNPNNVPIFVSAVNVAVSADSTPSGCSSAQNIELQQSNISASQVLTVPANGSVQLPAQGATNPRIRLKNLPTVNQDVCKNKSFALTYSGTATN